MAQRAQIWRECADSAARLQERLGQILTLGVALLAAAYLVPVPMLAFTAYSAGLGVVALAGLLFLIRRRREGSDQALFSAVSTFVEQDAAPSFTTDRDGMIGYQNAASLERFGPKDGATLVAVLGGLFASPAAVLYRLQNKAEARGAAREDVVLRRGHLRISVHSIGKRGFLWRLEDIAERGGAGRGAEGLSIPMLTASPTGTVLFMNDALRRLVGGRRKSLDRIVNDLPVRSGAVHEIAGEDGPVLSTVFQIAGAAGRSELFFMPAPEEGQALNSPLDTLPVPLASIGADGLVTSANREARELLGIAPGETPAFGSLVEGLGRPVTAWISETVERRAPARTEFLRVRRQSPERFVQVTLGAAWSDEGPFVYALMNDATELKTLEAQFVQSQKMQAIGQLAGGVAHDFNNLLTAIGGHCDLLLLRRDAGDPDYADLVQISQNTNRAASLVGQLLAFSRKQNLQPELIDPRDTISDLAHLLNRLVGETVRLSFRHDGSARGIRADKRQLEQVIMNLVVNARDAMPEGGEVTIETELATLRTPIERDRATVPPGEYVLVKVSDQGTGIAPEDLPRIFEPFFTTKRVGEGTGLGLSTVYGIVKQSGGFVFADSAPGSGTTFSLFFPAEDLAAAPAPSDRAAEGETVPAAGAGPAIGSDGPEAPGAAVAGDTEGEAVTDREIAETEAPDAIGATPTMDAPDTVPNMGASAEDEGAVGSVAPGQPDQAAEEPPLPATAADDGFAPEGGDGDGDTRPELRDFMGQVIRLLKPKDARSGTEEAAPGASGAEATDATGEMGGPLSPPDDGSGTVDAADEEPVSRAPDPAEDTGTRGSPTVEGVRRDSDATGDAPLREAGLPERAGSYADLGAKLAGSSPATTGPAADAEVEATDTEDAAAGGDDLAAGAACAPAKEPAAGGEGTGADAEEAGAPELNGSRPLAVAPLHVPDGSAADGASDADAADGPATPGGERDGGGRAPGAREPEAGFGWAPSEAQAPPADPHPGETPAAAAAGGFGASEERAPVGAVEADDATAGGWTIPPDIDAQLPRFGYASERNPVPGGAVVLLVEDEAPVRAFASRALRLRGFTVHEAACAEEALERLAEDALTVDVFVTDVVMPGMDGPTWVLKALEDRPEARVVFMSGYAEERIAESQCRVPNAVFLPKPFSLRELTDAVRQQVH